MRRILGITLLALAACGGGSDTGSDGTFGAMGMTNRMQIRLVDAPSDTVTEIVVTINKITAHVVGGGGWVDLVNKTQTVDLLKLQGGTFALLGITSMPAGKITELRLYTVDAGPNYVTTPDGVHHPLTVPSGDESGIKIKGGFMLAACASGNITLDFDGHKSIFTHPVGSGAGDEWILRPVIRLKSVQVTGSGCGDMAGGGGPGGGPGGPGTGADGGGVDQPPPGTGGGDMAGVPPGGGGGTGTSDMGTGGGGTPTGGGGGTGTSDMGGPVIGSPSGGGGTTGGCTNIDACTPNPWGTPIVYGNPSDPCASMTCATDQICENGVCVNLIP